MLLHTSWPPKRLFVVYEVTIAQVDMRQEKETRYKYVVGFDISLDGGAMCRYLISFGGSQPKTGVLLYFIVAD